MTKQSTVPFYGKITLMQPGQFKPITVVPLDETSTVAIDVPLTGEYVYNAVAYIAGQLEANTPKPVWTKEGVEYILDELNDMLNPQIKSEPETFLDNDKPQEVKDEDW